MALLRKSGKKRQIKTKTRRLRKTKGGQQKKNQANDNPAYVTQIAGSGNPFAYNSLFTSTPLSGGQLVRVGGQLAPAPMTACQLAANLPSLDEISLISSLATYGDTVRSIFDASVSAQTAASTASSAVALQTAAATTFNTAATSLSNAFYGNPDTGTKGIYKSITGVPYTPTPYPPAPSS